ncbi:hypothetical protein R6Q59_014564, partial [Mikania micrantha]
RKEALKQRTQTSNMVVCHCGRLATMKTSWTNNNPGRRFYTCPVSVIATLIL